MNKDKPFNNRKLPHETTVFVLGIVSIPGSVLYILPGIVCGILALTFHKRNKTIYLTDMCSYQTSFDLSRIGKICAFTGIAFSIIFFLFLATAILYGLGHYNV